MSNFLGRDSLSMTDKWTGKGAATMLGSMTHSFPNLFLSGMCQHGVSSNNTGGLDTLARHAAYIITESLRRAGDASQLVAIEPSEEAEEAWTAEILKYDLFAAPISVCTPGFFNCEGEILRPVSEEEELKRRRGATYMRGLPAFRKVLDEWRLKGQMAGIVIRT